MDDEQQRYWTVRSKLPVAVCAPAAVESVAITVKVTAPLWVGVPDKIPAVVNVIPLGGPPLTTDHA
jgi:hypothetical protein